MMNRSIFLTVCALAISSCSVFIPVLQNARAEFDQEFGSVAYAQDPYSSVSINRYASIGPKYDPLIFGKERLLVCSKPFPATGRMSGRPNIQLMWEHYLYPRPEGIWSEIGGNVERNGTLPFDEGRWINACTMRMSHMLNKAGHKIPDLEEKTVSGGNGDQYIFRLTDMEDYIVKTFGPPDINITDGTGNSWDLPDKPGIVMLDLPDSGYTGHISIWNGAGTVDGANIGGYRVAFWEMPCFVPANRKPKAFSEWVK